MKEHDDRKPAAAKSGDTPQVTAVAVATLVSGALTRRLMPRLPYMIVAMLVGSLTAAALNAWMGGPAATGIRTVGALAGHLPPLSVPDFSAGAVKELAFPALIVAILALTEAVAIARSVALRSGQAIDSNQEFIGQGLSNICGSFFSAYACSGSFNRSGANYDAGARTPLAAVFAAALGPDGRHRRRTPAGQPGSTTPDLPYRRASGR